MKTKGISLSCLLVMSLAACSNTATDQPEQNPPQQDAQFESQLNAAASKPEITQVQFVDAAAYLEALDNDITPTQVTSADMIGCDNDTSAIALVDSLTSQNWARFKSLMDSGCTQMPPNLKMDTMGYPADGVVYFKVHDMPAPGIYWFPVTDQPGLDEPVQVWQIQ